MSTRTKPTPINSLPPAERIERRLVGNVTGALNGLDYWLSEIERLKALPFELKGPSTYARIDVLYVKVTQLQREVSLAVEELDTFRTLVHGG